MDKNTATALLLAHMMNGGSFQYDKIALKLAAEDPVMFARLAGIASVDTDRWESRVIGFLQKNEKVSAIKELRTAWNIGLKEAKDAVDYYIDPNCQYPRWSEMSFDSCEAVRLMRAYSGMNKL